MKSSKINYLQSDSVFCVPERDRFRLRNMKAVMSQYTEWSFKPTKALFFKQFGDSYFRVFVLIGYHLCEYSITTCASKPQICSTRINDNQNFCRD